MNIKQSIKVSTANLAVTNKCNFRCRHCYFNSGKSLSHELNAMQMKKIIDGLKKISVKKMDITGGEPLLRDDLEEIISYAKKRGFYVKVLTNGLLLSKEKLTLLKKAGLDAIGISLDGSIPEIYNSVRNMDEDVFFQVIENIKNAVSFGFYVKINTVALDLNINDLLNISRLCTNLKVNEHRICYFTPKKRGKNLSGPSPIKWYDFVMRDLKETKSFVGFSLVEDNLEGCDCLMKEDLPLHIMSNGDVYSCALLVGEAKPMGNVLKESLQKIIQRLCPDPCYLKFAEPEHMKHTCPIRKFRASEI